MYCGEGGVVLSPARVEMLRHHVSRWKIKKRLLAFVKASLP